MLLQNISLHKLDMIFKSKKKSIFCFGSGKAFDNFFNEFAQYDLLKYVKAIADNKYREKEYSIKNVQNRTIPIISAEQMVHDISKQDIILITTAAYREVISQLEQIDKLKNIKYYLYFMLRIKQYDHDRLQIPIPVRLSAYSDFRIPKTIHYCWFGKEKIPVQYQKWMESWKRYCPDYQIIEWNESNYDIHKSRYISEAYEKKKWAFVSDYVRIDVVNEYGGVYLDTDIELLKNIDELLMNDAFCGFESPNYVAFGLGFGAAKGNRILTEIKNYYDNISFILEDGMLNLRTCPVIQTEIMKHHGLKCDGTFQIVDGMTVLPSRILCGMSPHSFRVEKKPVCTYAIHHYAASWSDSRLYDHKQFIYSCLKQEKDDDGYCYIE